MNAPRACHAAADLANHVSAVVDKPGMTTKDRGRLMRYLPPAVDEPPEM